MLARNSILNIDLRFSNQAPNYPLLRSYSLEPWVRIFFRHILVPSQKFEAGEHFIRCRINLLQKYNFKIRVKCSFRVVRVTNVRTDRMQSKGTRLIDTLFGYLTNNKWMAIRDALKWQMNLLYFNLTFLLCNLILLMLQFGKLGLWIVLML